MDRSFVALGKRPVVGDKIKSGNRGILRVLEVQGSCCMLVDASGQLYRFDFVVHDDHKPASDSGASAKAADDPVSSDAVSVLQELDGAIANRAASAAELGWHVSEQLPLDRGDMVKWIKVCATLLSIPSLAIWGLVGLALVLQPLIRKAGSAEMVAAGTLCLGLAAQAALTIWCALGRPPGRASWILLIVMTILPIGMAQKLSWMSFIGTYGDVEAPYVLMLFAAYLAGAVVAVMRRPQPRSSPASPTNR